MEPEQGKEGDVHAGESVSESKRLRMASMRGTTPYRALKLVKRGFCIRS